MILLSIVAASLALAPTQPIGGAPSAPRAAGTISTEAPVTAAHTLLVTEPSLVEVAGETIAVDLGWLLQPGDILLEGAAMHVGNRATMLESVYGGSADIGSGETIMVAPTPTPSPSTTGCTITCASGTFACCNYPNFCACKHLSQQGTAQCQSGGSGAVSCTVWAPAGGGGSGGTGGSGGGGAPN